MQKCDSPGEGSQRVNVTPLHLHPPKLSSCKSRPLCCVLPPLWVALWQPSLPHLQGLCPGLCVCAQLLSCVHLFCDPMDCSPPSSSVHRIFKARILKCVAISSSRVSSQPRVQTPALADRFLGSPCICICMYLNHFAVQ